MMKFPGIRPKPFSHISDNYEEAYPSTLLGLLDLMPSDSKHRSPPAHPKEATQSSSEIESRGKNKNLTPDPNSPATGKVHERHCAGMARTSPVSEIAKKSRHLKDQKEPAGENDRRSQTSHEFHSQSSPITRVKRKTNANAEVEHSEVTKNVDLLFDKKKQEAGRVAGTLYGGSEDLTFPYAPAINHHDVFEAKERKDNASKQQPNWEQHAQLRSTGVLVMKELIARCSKLKKACADLEHSLSSCQAQVKQQDAKLEELSSTNERKEREIRSLKSEVARLSASVESEKELRHIKVDRLNGVLQRLKAQLDALQEEKEQLASATSAVEADAKKHHDVVAVLRRELDDKARIIREDAGKLARLMHDSANVTYEKTSLERELQLLNEDFEYAKTKLKSCQQYTEQMERKHTLKIRNCFGEMERLQARLDAEAALRKDLEAAAAERAAAAAAAGERLAHLEQEMIRVQAVCAGKVADREAMAEDLRATRIKVQWAWLMVQGLVRRAFPPSQDSAQQTGLETATADVGTLVDLPAQVADFDSFWLKVRGAGERLHVLGLDKESQWSLPALLDFATTTYSRKLAVDAHDDREHKRRQTLPEFLHLFFLEETGSKPGAFRALCGLVANTLEHVRALHGGIMSTTVTAMKRDRVVRDVRRRSSVDFANPELRHEILTQQSVVARVDMFARLLHLDADAERHVPLEYLSLYLGLLLGARRGEYPLLPPVLQKMMVPTASVTVAMEQGLRHMRSHERLALLHQFEEEVSLKKEAVDLDAALAWVCDRWRTAVHERTDERLAALFAAADADGNGELDLREFRDLVGKVSREKARAVSTRQMQRMYAHMALAPRVDSASFVSHARAYGLGTFVIADADDSEEGAGGGGEGRQVLARAAGGLAKIESAVAELVARKAGDAIAMRAAHNVAVLKGLIRDGGRPYYAAHILALTLMECHTQAPQLELEPPPRPASLLRRSRTSRSPAPSPSGVGPGRSASPTSLAAPAGRRRERSPEALPDSAARTAPGQAAHETAGPAPRSGRGPERSGPPVGPPAMRRVVLQVPPEA